MEPAKSECFICQQFLNLNEYYDQVLGKVWDTIMNNEYVHAVYSLVGKTDIEQINYVKH